MLYELVGIARPGKIAEVKDIARSAGNLILNAGGVVRGITNWGIFGLPKPLRDTSARSTATSRQQGSRSQPAGPPKHFTGHYFIMRFDSNARTQHSVRRLMSLDTRLMRYSIVKMGDKFEEIADVGAKAEEWGTLGAQKARGERWNSTDSLSASRW